MMDRATWSVISRLRLGVAAVSAMAAVVLAAAPAGAYQTYNNHRLTYGVVGQKYWIADSALPHKNGINTRWARWNETSTPISYSRTWTKSQSRMDFYKVKSINSWWGATTFFVDTTRVNPNNRNWWWAKVRLDGDFANCPNKLGVIAHEQGHGMGLAHVSGGNPRLMRWDIAQLGTKKPWGDDVNGINHLY